jgi:hypothetical protein
MGRPAKYNTDTEMDEAIHEYFDSLIAEDGTRRPPTIAGLAYSLGFDSRQSMYDYGKDERFSYILKRARLCIEDYHESRMSGNNPTGSIFWLKNHAGYTDKQEISGKDDSPLAIKVIFE